MVLFQRGGDLLHVSQPAVPLNSGKYSSCLQIVIVYYVKSV